MDPDDYFDEGAESDPLGDALSDYVHRRATEAFEQAALEAEVLEKLRQLDREDQLAADDPWLRRSAGKEAAIAERIALHQQQEITSSYLSSTPLTFTLTERPQAMGLGQYRALTA